METIHIVPLPLVKVGELSYWGIPGIYQGPRRSKVERRIKKQLNAGNNAIAAFNAAYLSNQNQKILFVIDDINSEGDFAFEKEKLPFSLNTERIVCPPKELGFNVYCFSEKKLLKEGKKDYLIRTSSMCGTAFGMLMRLFPDSVLVTHIPQVCLPNIKNSILKQNREGILINVTDDYGVF